MTGKRYHKTKLAQKRYDKAYQSLEEQIDDAIDAALHDLHKQYGAVSLVSVSVSSVMIGRPEPIVTVIAEAGEA